MFSSAVARPMMAGAARPRAASEVDLMKVLRSMRIGVLPFMAAFAAAS
jgi:hypothetical protein